MRIPSRAAMTLAFGLIATSGLSAAAATASATPSHPSLARPAKTSGPDRISFLLPGTGVRLTSTLDESGDVTSTSSGDENGDEVTVGGDAVELGDDSDAAEPVDTESQSADDQGGDNQTGDNQTGDNQGEDQAGDGQSDSSGDNQGQDVSGDSSGEDPASADSSSSGDGSDNSGSDSTDASDSSGDGNGD